MLVAVAVVACAEPNPAYVRDASTDDASVIRPPGVPAVSCPPDRDLAACFRFERSTRDESASNLPVTTARAVVYGESLDGYALDVSADSRLQVGNTTLLDTSRLTIEVWLKPRTLPTAATRAGIIDYQRQYSLWVLPSGSVMCAIRGPGDLPVQKSR